MSLPKTFSAGERLFAADLNENFEELDDKKVASDNVNDIVVLTEAAYDNIATPDANTLYVVVD